MKCAVAGCPQNARQAVDSGVVVVLLCMRCWRELLARLVESAGITVRQLGPGWAS